MIPGQNDFPEFPRVDGIGPTFLDQVVDMRHQLRHLVYIANLDESDDIADAAQKALRVIRDLEDVMENFAFDSVMTDWIPSESR